MVRLLESMAVKSSSPPVDELVIRRAALDDLPRVAELFKPRVRSVQTFEWLLSSDDGTLRSFVAELDGQIVGHIGYVTSSYAVNGRVFKGVFTIEWIVDSKYSGPAGLKLYSEVMKIGDFTFVIGGTETVAKIYPMLKFHVPFQVSRFQKVIDPIGYFRSSINSSLLKRVAKSVVYSSRRLFSRRVKLSDIELVPGIGPVESDSTAIARVVEEEQIRWIESAPECEAVPLSVKKSGVVLCQAICILKKGKRSNFGRIAFVSNPPADHWREIVGALERYLALRGCCSLSVMASHQPFKDALVQNGYSEIRQSPFWLRDRKKHFDGVPWHLSYFEGDLAHRSIIPFDCH